MMEKEYNSNIKKTENILLKIRTMNKRTISMLAIAFAIVLSIGAFSYAYFTKKESHFGNLGMKIDMMFDRLTEEALEDYQINILGIQSEPNAIWGTEKNPYIISNINHMHNLSALQNIGYFYNLFVKNNFNNNGNYIVNSAEMPHFIVSTNEGKPVTIDGTGFAKPVEPAGTEDFPFIGHVKGAFSEGICATPGANGKNSDVSILYNIRISGNPKQVDIGLFGHIGFLGHEAAEGQSFDGVASEISDLVLADIKVEVKSTLWDNIISFVTDHMFTYTNLSENEKDEVPHENHHIGILAGHASYAKVERVSVYYSSDDIKAIDISDLSVVETVNSNYMSAVGILGFINNLNPEFDAAGKIIAGSGTSIGDISYGLTGGGGLLSGTGRGYVLASEIFNSYKYDVNQNPKIGDSINFYNAYDIDGNPLCTEWIRRRVFWGTERTGRYYFYDGVFTFALSDTSDTISTIWPDIVEGEEIISTLPNFVLAENNDASWEYGVLGTSYLYYATLTPVTTKPFDANKKYTIAWKDSTGNLHHMDLGTEGRSVPAISLTGTVTQENGIYEASWDIWADRNTFEQKLLKINPNGTEISGIVSGNKLGYRYSPGLMGLFRYDHIHSGAGSGNTYSYNANLTSPTEENTYWNIQYTANGATRYITGSKTAFGINASGTEEANKLYIFEVDFGVRAVNEDDEDAKKGWRPSLTPITTHIKDGVEHELLADQYVLWPNSILNQKNGDNVAVTTSPDPEYSLKRISDLNWNNRFGDSLGTGNDNSITSVDKMFNMTNPIDWTRLTSLNLFGGTFNLNNNAMITAPIGSDGAEANIPQGCVAFKVNKAVNAKIRVIVAVPTSNIVRGLDQAEDYYFGLWHTDLAGASWAQSFRKSDAIQKFELPRSQPKEDNSTGKAEYIKVKIADDDRGNETYRAYLHGEIVLVAYEFEIEDEGVYVLGSTNGPMRIVYFAADGVASSGRDGAGGGNLGTIDYVYDYGNKIIPVADTYSTGEDDEEDYNKYYPSFCIIYFDNGIKGNGVNEFIDINNGYFKVRRYIDSALINENIKSSLNVKFGSEEMDAITKEYMKAVEISFLSDHLYTDYEQ